MDSFKSFMKDTDDYMFTNTSGIGMVVMIQ
jgi:hypothetical protein